MPQNYPSPSSSAELLERLADGDQSAANEIFSRYMERLTRLARSRLATKLAARVDPEDIVMSAYRSFFVAARDGRFTISRGGDLWQLLVELTLHKLYHAAEHHLAKRRSTEREERGSELQPAILQIPSREPTPEEAVAAADELAAILNNLSERNRQIVELRLQGFEHEEIAERLASSERTVRRAINDARRLMIGRAGKSFVPSAARRRPTNAPRTGQRSASPVFNKDIAPLKWTDYLLQEQIGAGATGRVYKAVERSSNRQVAVKFLRKFLVGDAAAMMRFVREAQTVAALHHPAIVPVHGAGTTPGGGLFLVMDLVDGLDLEKVRRQQVVDINRALRWIVEAATAIDFAHRFHVIHCDLKPSNVLLGYDGRIRVTDFGLAMTPINSNPSGAHWAGTPAFMAPEQVDSCWGTISPATDVWGLGGVLYFLLFSRPPHLGADVPATLGNVRSKTPVELPPTRSSNVPDSVIDALRRCLAKTPGDRPATPGQLVSELSKVVDAL